MSFLTHLANTLQPHANEAQLDAYGVDQTPGRREHLSDALEVYDDHVGQGNATSFNARIVNTREVEFMDLWVLSEGEGLLPCAATGDIHANVRRYLASPGRGWSGVGALGDRVAKKRGGVVSEVGDAKRPVPPIDTTAENWQFQERGFFPVHGVIGQSQDLFWTPNGQSAKNAWRDQLLDIRVYALFEERFAHRIRLPSGEGMDPEDYDPKHPPALGLINWQEMDIRRLLTPIRELQERAASKNSRSGEAERLLTVYKRAELNAQYLQTAMRNWRQGKIWEPLGSWLRRRVEIFRKMEGPNAFVDLAAVDAPVDLAAKRAAALSRLEAEWGETVEERMERLERERDEALAATEAAPSADADEGAEVNPAAAEVTDGDALAALVAGKSKAYRLGAEAAADGKPEDANHYQREPQISEWIEGYRAVKNQ